MNRRLSVIISRLFQVTDSAPTMFTDYPGINWTDYGLEIRRKNCRQALTSSTQLRNWSFHAQIMKKRPCESHLDCEGDISTCYGNANRQQSFLGLCSARWSHSIQVYHLLSYKRFWLFIMVNSRILKNYRLSHDVVTWSGLQRFDVWTLLVFFRRLGRLVSRQLMKNDVLLWLAGF